MKASAVEIEMRAQVIFSVECGCEQPRVEVKKLGRRLSEGSHPAEGPRPESRKDEDC